jgi:hypothetical protein
MAFMAIVDPANGQHRLASIWQQTAVLVKSLFSFIRTLQHMPSLKKKNATKKAKHEAKTGK